MGEHQLGHPLVVLAYLVASSLVVVVEVVSFEVASAGVAFGLEHQQVAFIVGVIVSVGSHLGCIDLFDLVSWVFVGC